MLSELLTFRGRLIGIQVLSEKPEGAWRNKPIKEPPDQLFPSVAPLFCHHGNRRFPLSSSAPGEQQSLRL